MQIIGLTGPIRAGKSSILKILEKKGFKGYKFSDLINEEIKKRGLEISRKLQQDIGNQLREKFGGDYWASLILKKANQEKEDKIVIDGIRNPSEIKFLKQNGAVVVGVSASEEVRKNRFFLDPLLPNDVKTEKDFQKANKRDRGVGENTFGQKVKETLRMADIVVENNRNDLKELERKLTEKLLGIGIIVS